MFKGWKKDDSPPWRVKLIPLSVLSKVASMAETSSNPRQRAIADMIMILFYFLLRPGEYTLGGSKENKPFLLQDIQLFLRRRCLKLATCSLTELLLATFGTLEFTDQKNGVKGKVIELDVSGDNYICPVRALIFRVMYLRDHDAAPDTSLATLFDDTAKGLTSRMITDMLREAVKRMGSDALEFLPKNISAWCLRAAGANALLLSGVDGNIIRLIG